MSAPTAAETFELREALWATQAHLRVYRWHFGADTATAAKLDHLASAIETATTELSLVAQRMGVVEKRVDLIGRLPDEWLPEGQIDAFYDQAAALDVHADVVNMGPGKAQFVLRGSKDAVNTLLLSEHVEVPA